MSQGCADQGAVLIHVMTRQLVVPYALWQQPCPFPRSAVGLPGPLLPRRANGGAFLLQTPYSQLGEALSKGEWQDL